jgi:uncharacterized protein
VLWVILPLEMRLYSASSREFMDDTVKNRIADKLKDTFFGYFRYYPPPSEVASWRNSLRATAQVFSRAGLTDHGVILEYWLPVTSKRLDCLVCGRDSEARDEAVIIELKQWERSGQAIGDNELIAFLGGAEREVLHPSVQVGQYSRYLEDAHTAFYAGDSPVKVSACSYLHNYTITPDDALLASKFADSLLLYPVFGGADIDPFCEYLSARLDHGQGMDVLGRIEQSEYRPSKKLLDHVAQMIRRQPAYTLLDEQLVVFDRVVAEARAGLASGRKLAIIVKGGPGTGKSVVAINLMATLLGEGFNAHYATGSKAFTETLRKIIGRRGSVQFQYFNSYTDVDEEKIDVLIADEAHRIRATSAGRYTPRNARPDLPQVRELLNASRLAVFFVDDHQVVRPNEIGSADYIRSHALELGCRVLEYELEAQFRCNGSDAFVNWINNTLGVRRTANVIWDRHEEFDFKIYDDPFSLEGAIRKKAAEGFSARVVAGFCWEWSPPDEHGYLREDVVVGEYRRPWDARYDAKKLAPGIPKASLWAYDPNGLNQVGCVYTAQGFEFDYVGVIFGPDLIYDPALGSWKGVPKNSADRIVKRSKDHFTELVKNTYRVLLSRGLRGCYVHFMDESTRNFFRSRME